MQLNEIREVLKTMESDDYVLRVEIYEHDIKLRLNSDQVTEHYTCVFDPDKFNETIFKVQVIKSVNEFYDRRFTQTGKFSQTHRDIIDAFKKQCRAIHPNFKIEFENKCVALSRWFGDEPLYVDTAGRSFNEFYEELLTIQKDYNDVSDR